MFLKIAKKGKNDLGLYIATIVMVILGYFLGQVLLLIVILRKMDDTRMSTTESQTAIEEMNFGVFGMSQNFSMFLILLTFIVGTIALWLGVSKLPKKRFLDLITPKSKINWSKILFSFGQWFALTLVFAAAFYFFNPENYQFQFELQSFLILAIIAIFILPIQTSFEELFLRRLFSFYSF